MADHSDPRPEGPHVSFKLLTSFLPQGAVDEKVMEKKAGVLTGKQVQRSYRTFTVAIESVGKAVGPNDKLEDFVRATDILENIHLTMDLETVRARFKKVGVAINDKGSVTDISRFLETETEPRALLEMRCSTRFDIVDNPGYFNKVQLSGDFDTNGDGNADVSTGIIDIDLSN